LHEKLDQTVLKHLRSPFKKPVERHNIDAYQTALENAAVHYPGKKLILDSGCGNSKSTRYLARQFPGHFVIGIDKSAARIQRGKHRFNDGKSSNGNFCVIRADLVDFWRLAAADGVTIDKHFILYPNPWPRSQHLKRRWHGSPLFKTIIELGGQLVVRTNWQIYTAEFRRALQLAGYDSELTELEASDITTDHSDMTDFETKYRLSGHQLWQLSANLTVDK